jgi:zinc transporter ZupT
MDGFPIQLVLFGILAALANILGGLVLFPAGLHAHYRWTVKYLLAIGAGFMLAVTFFEIIPRTVLAWQTAHPDDSELYVPMLLILAGYLLTQFFEHAVAPHFHLAEEVTSETVISTTTAYSGITGFLIHTFFDGIAIAAATQMDAGVGLLVFIAVVIHKFPEGFTIGSLVLAAGKGRGEVLKATALVGFTTLLGVALFAVLGNWVGMSVVYALPLASGVTIYVAASDLVPEINHHGGRRVLVSLALFGGVALFFGLHLLVSHLGGE